MLPLHQLKIAYVDLHVIPMELIPIETSGSNFGAVANSAIDGSALHAILRDLSPLSSWLGQRCRRAHSCMSYKATLYLAWMATVDVMLQVATPSSREARAGVGVAS